MKRLVVLLPLLLIFLVGCTQEGTLRIESNSGEEVWYEVNEGSTNYLYAGQADEYTWDLSSGISGEETKNVRVDFGGDYWFFYDYYTDVVIKPDESRTITILGDAGEIEIWNDSDDFEIWYVYLSPSSDIDWGDDDLGNDIIGPGESVIKIRKPPALPEDS